MLRFEAILIAVLCATFVTALPPPFTHAAAPSMTSTIAPTAFTPTISDSATLTTQTLTTDCEESGTPCGTTSTLPGAPFSSVHPASSLFDHRGALTMSTITSIAKFSSLALDDSHYITLFASGPTGLDFGVCRQKMSDDSLDPADCEKYTFDGTLFSGCTLAPVEVVTTPAGAIFVALNLDCPSTPHVAIVELNSGLGVTEWRTFNLGAGTLKIADLVFNSFASKVFAVGVADISGTDSLDGFIMSTGTGAASAVSAATLDGTISGDEDHLVHIDSIESGTGAGDVVVSGGLKTSTTGSSAPYIAEIDSGLSALTCDNFLGTLTTTDGLGIEVKANGLGKIFFAGQIEHGTGPEAFVAALASGTCSVDSASIYPTPGFAAFNVDDDTSGNGYFTIGVDIADFSDSVTFNKVQIVKYSSTGELASIAYPKIKFTGIDFDTLQHPRLIRWKDGLVYFFGGHLGAGIFLVYPDSLSSITDAVLTTSSTMPDGFLLFGDVDSAGTVYAIFPGSVTPMSFVPAEIAVPEFSFSTLLIAMLLGTLIILTIRKVR